MRHDLDFTTTTETPRPKAPPRRTALAEWFSRFSSTLLAVVIGGAVLLAGVRYYAYWSVRDYWRQVAEAREKERPEQEARDRKSKAEAEAYEAKVKKDLAEMEKLMRDFEKGLEGRK